jgi:serine/threonine-protein kinase
VADVPPVDDSDARARDRIGQILDDKWTLERLIGSGGMGAVYAGRHRNGARAAIKVLHAEYARDPELRSRFLREGYAANKVEHKGALRVLDDDIVASGPDEGTAYLVMELLEGESLYDRVARDPTFTERDFLELASAVLDVLESAHARGVVHRDLKTENLFLPKGDEGVTVKVLDFGLARVAEAGTSITRAGLALGTPSFMSPEQAAGRTDEVDGRTDLFALGVIGFRLLARRKVHEADNAMGLVMQMANVPAPPIRSVAPQVSESVARIIDRALQFRREDRYPDATSMRAAVTAALAALAMGNEPTLFAIPAARPAPPDPAPPASVRSAPSAVREPSEPPAPPSRGGRLRGLALLLLGGGVLAFFALPGSAARRLLALRDSLVGTTTTSGDVPPRTGADAGTSLEPPRPAGSADAPRDAAGPVPLETAEGGDASALAAATTTEAEAGLASADAAASTSATDGNDAATDADTESADAAIDGADDEDEPLAQDAAPDVAATHTAAPPRTHAPPHGHPRRPHRPRHR